MPCFSKQSRLLNFFMFYFQLKSSFKINSSFLNILLNFLFQLFSRFFFQKNPIRSKSLTRNFKLRRKILCHFFRFSRFPFFLPFLFLHFFSFFKLLHSFLMLNLLNQFFRSILYKFLSKIRKIISTFFYKLSNSPKKLLCRLISLYFIYIKMSKLRNFRKMNFRRLTRVF